MLADVSDQGAGLSEGFATDITHTRLLTCKKQERSQSLNIHRTTNTLLLKCHDERRVLGPPV